MNNYCPIAPTKPTSTGGRLVYFFFQLIEILLIFRLALKFIGADAGNGFVGTIYLLTQIFVLPFTGILPQVSSHSADTMAILELSSLVAIIVYAVLAQEIRCLAQILSERSHWKRSASVLVSTAIVFTCSSSRALAATPTVDLLTADSFAVLAGSAVNDSNISVITGDVGLSPSAWFSALTCAEVTGTVYSVDGSGPFPCRVTDLILVGQAQTDLTAAFTDAGGRTGATVLPGGDNQLGGQTLTDGVYSFSGGAATANLIGTLTLDGQGDSDSVFILQSSSDLVTGSASSVVLTNGAQACNVFWHVPTSATLGTGTNFVGTIMADQSITDAGGSTIDGRFLARIAAVTLDDTTISQPTCIAPSPAPSAPASSAAPVSAAASVSSSSDSSSDAACPPLTYATPIILSTNRLDPDSISLTWGPYSGTENFNIRYGYTNGEWLYSTNVTGFSAVINDLPANVPIWFQVAARSDCAIGSYSEAKLAGGGLSGNPLIPGLPNTGFTPNSPNIPLFVMGASFVGLIIFLTVRRKSRSLPM